MICIYRIVKRSNKGLKYGDICPLKIGIYKFFKNDYLSQVKLKLFQKY